MATSSFDAATLVRHELRERLASCGPEAREALLAEVIEVWLGDVDTLLRATGRGDEADVLVELDAQSAFRTARAMLADVVDEPGGAGGELLRYCRAVLEEVDRWVEPRAEPGRA